MIANPQKPVPGQMGVITHNVVSMRAKPDAKAEQTTQALIGQTVSVQGGQRDWVFVQTWDWYRAWVQADRVRTLDGDAPYASTGPVAVVRELFADIFSEPHERSEVITKATISAELELVRAGADWNELKLPSGRHGFIRKHDARLVEKDLAQTIWLPDPRKLAETAMRFIGVPYLWGGTSPFGIDCSGFVQLIYHVQGVTLLRDAYMQASDPRAIPLDKSDLAAGDLVFFAGKKQDGARITHVGMMLDRERFIHSCGDFGVIITPLDDSYYQSIYQCAVRMRLDTLDPGGGAPRD